MLEVIFLIPAQCFHFFIGKKKGSTWPRRFGPALNEYEILGREEAGFIVRK